MSGCVGDGESHNNKRPATDTPISAPTGKRRRNNADDFHSWYDQDDQQSNPDFIPERENLHSDPDYTPDADHHPALTLDQVAECEADPEPYIEVFQGPFLNVSHIWVMLDILSIFLLPDEGALSLGTSTIVEAQFHSWICIFEG